MHGSAQWIGRSNSNGTAPKKRGYAICSITQPCVDDGVVIGKNGVLIAGWEYTGDDNASVTDTERDVVSVRINQALARLGTGWMLHVDAVRIPANVYSAREFSHFPDRVSRGD